MLLASKIHAVGMLRMYRLNPSAQTSSISPTISQAHALPIQVLMPSMVWRNFSTVMNCAVPAPSYQSNAPSGILRMVLALRCSGRSDRLRTVPAPVVIERHLPADDRVLLPLGLALGEGERRLDDLLEQRIF